jgi:uncharacterized protein YcbK (DUF882 family)
MEKVEKGLHSAGEMEDGGSVGSKTATPHGSTGLFEEMMHLAEQAMTLPEPPKSRWHRAGISPRMERLVNVIGGTVLALLAIGWTWSIADAAMRSPDEVVALGPRPSVGSVATAGAPNAVYLTDASLNALTGELRGASGKLRAKIRPAGAPLDTGASLPEGAELRAEQPESGQTTTAPSAGIWKLAVAMGQVIKPITDFRLISTIPASAKQNGRVGLYYIGNWPGENGRISAPRKAPADRYRPPSGFIEVTPENADTRVSEHFKLRDFLTHDQANVWPKFLVLQIRNVDKLELVLADLQSHGIDVSGVRVMSGFRTPQYNKGGGNTGGRAGLSRHMYGDAADIFIDSNHDGVMDDLNHDGRSTIDDARVISQAVDRVEAAHPELIGGAGVYPAESGHGPFIHIDSRGYRARWIGSGGGS